MSGGLRGSRSLIRFERVRGGWRWGREGAVAGGALCYVDDAKRAFTK